MRNFRNSPTLPPITLLQHEETSKKIPVESLLSKRYSLMQSMSQSQTPQLIDAFNSLTNDLLSVSHISHFEIHRLSLLTPHLIQEQLRSADIVYPMPNIPSLLQRTGSHLDNLDLSLHYMTHKMAPDVPLMSLCVASSDNLITNLFDVLPHRPYQLKKQTNHPYIPHKSSIFYSISTVNRGIKGLRWAPLIIHLVESTVPNSIYKSTLSPIPGFRSWLVDQIQTSAKSGKPSLIFDPELFSDKNQNQKIGDMHYIFDTIREPVFFDPLDHNWVPDPLVFRFGNENYPVTESNVTESSVKKFTCWVSQDPERAHRILNHLTRFYILHIKRPNSYAFDNVAHFHFSNGAEFLQVNVLGDPSPIGVLRSCGSLVNYLYTDVSLDRMLNSDYSLTKVIPVSPVIRVSPALV